MFRVLELATVQSVYTVDSMYGLVEMVIVKLGTTRLGLVLITISNRTIDYMFANLRLFDVAPSLRYVAKIFGILRSPNQPHPPEFNWSGLPRKHWK